MRSIRLILTILTALAALSASGAKPPLQTGSQVLECTEPVPQYQDGRPTTKYRLEAIDQGVVLRHGNGPGKCDYLGARDIWVFKDAGTYYIDRKSTRLNSSHLGISYAVFCLKKKKK